MCSSDLVGPVAPDEVAELVQRLSGGLAFVPRPELADPPPCQVDQDPAPAPSGWREVSETQDVRQEVLALGFRTRVQRAVRNTEAGQAAVSEGVQAVHTSGEAFEAIVQSVERLTEQIQEVSAAAQQMAASSEQAVKAVEEIAAVTEENAAAAQEVSSTTQEQSSAVEQIASSASSLAAMAQELMRAVGAFRV